MLLRGQDFCIAMYEAQHSQMEQIKGNFVKTLKIAEVSLPLRQGYVAHLPGGVAPPKGVLRCSTSQGV